MKVRVSLLSRLSLSRAGRFASDGMRRRWLRWSAAAGGIAVLYVVLVPRSEDTPRPITVTREDLVVGVAVEGELRPVREISLGPPAAVEYQLKIAQLAPEGAEVEKGDPLIGFDTQQVRRQLEQVTSQLATATADIERTRLDLDVQLIDLEQRIAQAESERDKATLQAQVPEELVARVEAQKSQLELTGKERALQNLLAERVAARARSDAALGSLETRRSSAAAQVEKLSRAIERMTVRAPQDGVVIYETNWNGEKKKVGDNVWFGETILSLPDLSEMRAEGMIDEADAGRVAVGQVVTLRLEARPDLDLSGRVTNLGQAVRRRSWRVPAKVFRVEIALSEPDASFMKPAMRFRGEIEIERLPGRLCLPRSAVFHRATGPVVFARRFWRWAETPVQLGEQSETSVEIKGGLREQERVLPLDLAQSAGGKSAQRVELTP
jgi:HlyD family secretion protein